MFKKGGETMKTTKKIQAGTYKQAAVQMYCTPVVQCCSASGDAVFVGTQEGLLVRRENRFVPFEAVTGNVRALYTAADATLWCACDRDVYIIKEDSAQLVQHFTSPVRGFSEDEKRLWILTEEELYRTQDGAIVRHCRVEDGNGSCIAAFGDGGVFVYNGKALLGLHGKRPRWGGVVPALSGMPTDRIHALAGDRWGHLFIGTADGLVLYDGKNAWYTDKEIKDLPDGCVTAVVIAADGSRYIGTHGGLLLQRGVRRRCYTQGRWLPSNHVTAIAVHPDRDEIWVGTDKGVSCISFTEMTLAGKAEHFQQIAEKYHLRESYFSYRLLNEAGNMDNGRVEISDNDGLWTGSFLGAMACKYAVTGDAHTLSLARSSMRALLKLFAVTGISGFPARAYRRPGEDRYGNGNPEWHLTQDEKGDLEWKGETSSDETTGHFFGLSFYYDMCADDAEKADIRACVCACVDHILANGYTLCDADGLPTTWSHWGPHELNRVDFWRWERGCNSLELLCMLRTAYHMSADEKYIREYERLIKEEHYAVNCMQHKMEDGHENHIDDNLGFLTTATLLRYEDDPHLKAVFLSGLLHHWQYERVERCPFYNLIFGHYADGECCDLDAAVQSLKDLPLSFINDPIVNSHRKDIVWTEEALAYGGDVQPTEPLPYDEKPVSNFDSDVFRADGSDAMEANLPTIYLLPYWYGRWCGLLAADEE